MNVIISTSLMIIAGILLGRYDTAWPKMIAMTLAYVAGILIYHG